MLTSSEITYIENILKLRNKEDRDVQLTELNCKIGSVNDNSIVISDINGITHLFTNKKYVNMYRHIEKKYNLKHNVGKAKYLVSFHNGDKFHKDGSRFYDIEIFKNKLKLNSFLKDLRNKGYIEK